MERMGNDVSSALLYESLVVIVLLLPVLSAPLKAPDCCRGLFSPIEYEISSQHELHFPSRRRHQVRRLFCQGCVIIAGVA